MVMADDDPRLCRSYASCDDFQRSYRGNQDRCIGCAGDITSLRAVSRVLDEELAPLIDVARHAAPEDIAETIVEVIATRIPARMAADLDQHIAPQEAGMLVTYRLLQRVALLEAQTKMRKRAR